MRAHRAALLPREMPSLGVPPCLTLPRQPPPSSPLSCLPFKAKVSSLVVSAGSHRRALFSKFSKMLQGERVMNGPPSPPPLHPSRHQLSSCEARDYSRGQRGPWLCAAPYTSRLPAPQAAGATAPRGQVLTEAGEPSIIFMASGDRWSRGPALQGTGPGGWPGACPAPGFGLLVLISGHAHLPAQTGVPVSPRPWDKATGCGHTCFMPLSPCW